MAGPTEPQWLTAAQCAERTGLTAINSIVILKALGLTLTQIRDVLAANPPSLSRILEIQADQWKSKRDSAERALTLVSVAQEAKLRFGDGGSRRPRIVRCGRRAPSTPSGSSLPGPAARATSIRA